MTRDCVGPFIPIKLVIPAKPRCGLQTCLIISIDEGGRIEASDTTFFFCFKDDIVIRVKPAGKMGARLDIRSKSRVGLSDLGANAAHIWAYMKALANTG